MEVKVAEMKLKTSLGEMRAEATTRAEKMRDVELVAWLKRDDKRTLESREKRRKDHAEDAESGARTTTSFLEDEEEKEKEETPPHVEEEDERWLRRAREKVREATARYRVEFVERETTKAVVLKKTTTKVRHTKTQHDKMFLEEEEDSSTK